MSQLKSLVCCSFSLADSVIDVNECISDISLDIFLINRIVLNETQQVVINNRIINKILVQGSSQGLVLLIEQVSNRLGNGLSVNVTLQFFQLRVNLTLGVEVELAEHLIDFSLGVVAILQLVIHLTLSVVDVAKVVLEGVELTN